MTGKPKCQVLVSLPSSDLVIMRLDDDKVHVFSDSRYDISWVRLKLPQMDQADCLTKAWLASDRVGVRNVSS